MEVIQANFGELSPTNSRSGTRAESDQFQMLHNLLREQVNAQALELAAIRQEISTLRLADSRGESQQAEFARVLRDTQAEVQLELSTAGSRMQELVMRVEQTSKEQLTSLSFEAKLNALSEALETEKAQRLEATANFNQVSTTLQKVLQAVSEIRQMREPDPGVSVDELQQFKSEAREAIGEVAETAQASAFAEIRALSETVENDRAARVSELDALRSEQDQMLDMALNPVCAGLQAAMTKIESVASEVLKHTVDLRQVNQCLEPNAGASAVLEQRLLDSLAETSGEQKGRFSQLRDLIMTTSAQEKAARDGCLVDLRETMRNEIKEQRAAVHEQLSDLIQAHLSNFEARVSGLSDDHRDQNEVLLQNVMKIQEASGDDFRRLLMQEEVERGQRDGALAETQDRLKAALADHAATIERRLAETALELKTFRQRNEVEQAARVAWKADLEETVRKNAAASDSKAEELIISTSTLSIAEISKALAAFESLQADLQNRVIKLSTAQEEWNADFKATSTKQQECLSEHTSLLQQLSSDGNLCQHQSKNVAEKVDAVERRLNEDVKSVKSSLHDLNQLVDEMEHKNRSAAAEASQEFDARYSSQRQGVFDLEQKIRTEITDVSSESQVRHNDVRNQLSSFAIDAKDRQNELQDTFFKTQQKFRDEVLTELQASEMKLRRDITDQKANQDSNMGSFRDIIWKDQQDRQTSFDLQIKELDRRSREALNDFGATYDDKFGSLQSSLSSLGKKLRDEYQELFRSSQADNLSQYSQSKEHLQRIATELRSEVQATNDGLLGQLSQAKENMLTISLDLRSQLQAASDSWRGTLASSLEAQEEQINQSLQTRLTRELSNSFRDQLRTSSEENAEWIAKERQARERGLGQLADRLQAQETKQVADVSQLMAQKSNADELCELRAVVAEVAEKTQASLAVREKELIVMEQDSRNSARELFEMRFEQEKAAREGRFEQEKAAREGQHDTMREYLAQDRLTTESSVSALGDRLDRIERDVVRASSIPPDLLSRAEFEGMLKRLWETVEAHSYSIAALRPSSSSSPPPKAEATVTSAPSEPPAVPVTVVRNMPVSPMASQRALSPMVSERFFWPQSLVPSAVVQPADRTTFQPAPRVLGVMKGPVTNVRDLPGAFEPGITLNLSAASEPTNTPVSVTRPDRSPNCFSTDPFSETAVLSGPVPPSVSAAIDAALPRTSTPMVSNAYDTTSTAFPAAPPPTATRTEQRSLDFLLSQTTQISEILEQTRVDTKATNYLWDLPSSEREMAVART